MFFGGGDCLCMNVGDLTVTIKLHYSQTGEKRNGKSTLFCYPIKLHYSQTIILIPLLNILFCYPIKLHYSQTMSS